MTPPRGFQIVMLEAKVEGCAIEVYLNDIPTVLLAPNGCFSVSRPVSQLVIEGENQLRIVVNPGASPGAALSGEPWTASSQSRASVRLASYAPAVFPGDPSGVEHLFHHWQGDDQEAGSRIIDRTFDWASGTPPASLGPWSWLSGDLLNTPAALTQVQSVIARMHNAFAIHDADFLIYMATPGLREICAAYALDPVGELSMFRSILMEEFSRDDWAMEPLEPEAFDLRLCAGGRLVECCRRDREPVLRATLDSEGQRYSYPMFVGAIGGELYPLG